MHQIARRLKLRQVLTSWVCQDNARILFGLAKTYAARGEWQRALCVLIRQLWRLYPPNRLARVWVDELIARCLLNLGHFNEANRFFFRACITFDSVNRQNCSYYRANMARLLFFVSVASYCLNKTRRALSYFKYAQELLSKRASKRQKILINVLGAHIYARLKQKDLSIVHYKVALALLNTELSHAQIVVELAANSFLDFLFLFNTLF